MDNSKQLQFKFAAKPDAYPIAIGSLLKSSKRVFYDLLLKKIFIQKEKINKIDLLKNY